MGNRGRGWVRFLALVGVLAGSGLLAGCVPDPPAEEAPPPPPDTLVVYGDSLVGEAQIHLRERLRDLLPDWDVRIWAQGGTAQCDWHVQMQEDADDSAVDAVVIAFSGNSFTPCITSRPKTGGYAADANWALDLWRSAGIVPAFVAGPPRVGTTLTTDTVGNVYRAVGAARGATVADTAPLFVDPGTGVYAATMPCLVGECTGTIMVRSIDDVHFCPMGHALPAGCAVYSSGVVRYVEAIVHGVAAEVGIAQPPYRAMVPAGPAPPGATTTVPPQP